MPKSTFFRLEEEKQLKIIEAGILEFSSAPLHEASIANIIKSAEIPRGSFYQYFSGKEDLFYYLIEIVRKKPETYFFELYKESEGDIFKTFDEYFDYFSEEVLLGKHASFYKNLFLHMDYKGTNKVMMDEDEKKARIEHIKLHKEEHSVNFKKLYDTINPSLFMIESEKEFMILFRLLSSMMFSSINEAYRMEMLETNFDIETIKKDFHTKLKWLRYGVSKQERGGLKND